MFEMHDSLRIAGDLFALSYAAGWFSCDVLGIRYCN